MTDETTSVVDVQANTGVSLLLSDIQNAVKVIDYAADQGAFKGWQTVEQVLLVRNRLNAFATAAEAAQKATETTQAAEAAATDTAPAATL